MVDNADAPHGRFLGDLMHLKKSLDSSVLTRIPASLSSLTCHSKIDGADANRPGAKSEIHTVSNIVNHNEEKSVDNPLLIPRVWRRPDYARLTLKELEQHLVHTSLGREKNNSTPRNEIIHENGMNSVNTPNTLFTALYNECSLSAMANWAMLDCSRGNDSTISTDVRQMKKLKKERKKPVATHTTQTQLELPPPMFHLCGVCRGFGHYEIECELLQTGGGYHQRKTSEDSQCNGSGTNKRKRSNYDVANINTKIANLDEAEKKWIIAKLAKEIDALRKQTGDKGAVLMASTASESSSRNSTISSIESWEGERNGYVGKNPCCTICRNRSIINGEFIACDSCRKLFHVQCIYPSLSSKAKGAWFCNACQSRDSDACSVVEVEGCGEIEQRKHSTAVGSNNHSRDDLGTAEGGGVEKDRSYVTKHLERRLGHDSGNFFVGEVCWVERFKDELNLTRWWPAFVIDGGANNAYKVKMFEIDDVGDDRSENELRPYFFYYEEFGYRPFFAKRDESNKTFRQALIQSVSKLGLKSLGQALQLARTSLQVARMNIMEDNEWKDAEIDTVDDIIIMAKRNGETLHPKLSDASIQSHVPDALSSPIDSAEDLLPEKESGRMVAQFSVSEIVGSIVSWKAKLGNPRTSTGDAARSDVQYGVVVSVDAAIGAALVRSIPSLYNGGINDAFTKHDANDSTLAVAVDDVGSPAWIPLKQLRFVCNNVVLGCSGEKIHLSSALK